MDKQSKETLVKDAIMKVRNRLLDDERCQICGEPFPIIISEFAVAGDAVESDESMCDDCFRKVQHTIWDMESKLQKEHCY